LPITRPHAESGVDYAQCAPLGGRTPVVGLGLCFGTAAVPWGIALVIVDAVDGKPVRLLIDIGEERI
jgi:hypothetical protein